LNPKKPEPKKPKSKQEKAVAARAKLWKENTTPPVEEPTHYKVEVIAYFPKDGTESIDISDMKPIYIPIKKKENE